MSKCKYYRGAENETRVPSCGVEAGEVYNTVHPEDAMEREYCPFFVGAILGGASASSTLT